VIAIMELDTGLGIEPVPAAKRRLGFWDYVVLWGDLGIGLLVLLAGSFLVPGLSLPQALLAIVLGSVIGVALLALAGVAGSHTGVPTMVLLRPALGIRGSYLPTAFNVVQLVGWTIFELIIMGYAANAVSKAYFGLDVYWFWLAFFTVVVIGMGVWGPLAVVRQWLGRFAVWIMLGTTLWITWLLLTRYDIAALWRQPGDGSFPFWAAVDLVIALPISWMPLVADYSRFARRPTPAAWGTALGYLIANLWFFSLGALILLAARVTQEPKGFVEAMMLIAGPLALLVLLVDETDEGWADLYSCAVSLQNVFPQASQRGLILGLGVVCYVAALFPDLTTYEHFLLLIGSVFVPLFGVLACDFFVLRKSYDTAELFRVGGAYWGTAGLRPTGLAAWVLGIVAYLAIAGKLSWLGLAGLPWLGASVPSFLCAFGLYRVLEAISPAPEPVIH
jgi:NCS1 family nucleobase:cation symporter-1